MSHIRLSVTDLGVFFDERHHALASRLIEIAGELAPVKDPAEVAALMGRLGLYEWLLPEQGAIDVRALCLIRELLGYVSPLADAIFAVQGLGSYPLLLAGSGHADDELRALLSRCRRGEAIGAFALTEPEAGSDVAAMAAVAREEGTHFAIDGEKTFISNVGIASHYIVFANADPYAGKQGISAFLVARGAEGLREDLLPLNIDHPLGALTLRDAPGRLIGVIGGGFKLAMQTLDTFRVTVGAAACGMARRALDAALAHVRSRSQFGKPLAEQPVIQSYLADMATELDAARLLVFRAALTKDQNPGQGRASTEVAMAKLYATEAAQRIIDQAVQLFGGRGVLAGEVVETLYRAIRPLRIYEGTSEIQRVIIGRALVRPA